MALSVAALLAAGALVVTVAYAALPAISIPGVSGPAVEIPAAQRLSSGSGLFIARIDTANAQTLAGQVQANGALDLAYGNAGLAGVPAGSTFIPTSLAIDPTSGTAWIGGTNASASQLISLSGDGSLETHFGTHGILTLPGEDDGGITALAWQHGRLLVAAGNTKGCTGCRLSILHAGSGERIAAEALTPVALGGAGCMHASVTSAVFSGSGRELLGVRVPAGSTCTASVVSLDADLSSTAPHATPGTTSTTTATFVAANSGQVCEADASAEGLRAKTAAGNTTESLTRTAAESLIGLLPIGGTACGALLSRKDGTAEVVQVSAGTTQASVTRLSAGDDPQSMFRCHQHLLVLATEGPARRRQAVILPVPITRGPNVLLAPAAQELAATTTGCP